MIAYLIHQTATEIVSDLPNITLRNYLIICNIISRFINNISLLVIRSILDLFQSLPLLLYFRLQILANPTHRHLFLLSVILFSIFSLLSSSLYAGGGVCVFTFSDGNCEITPKFARKHS